MQHAFRRSVVAVCVAMTLAGCSTFEYNHDFDPAVDFKAYKTYMWMQVAAPEQQHPSGMNELLEKRFIAAIDATLASKGFTKSETAPADFVVHFVGTTAEKVDFTSYYTGWGYYGWYGGTQVVAQPYTEGTLIIDVFDATSKAMAWRGTATGAVDPTISPEERNMRIQDVVAGVLQSFPPRK